ncbi:hypothetical protein B0I35DRAFT_441196, partial [Stachybotrys elegans]
MKIANDRGRGLHGLGGPAPIERNPGTRVFRCWRNSRWTRISMSMYLLFRHLIPSHVLDPIQTQD